MATRGVNARPIVIRRIKKGGHAHHGGAWKVAYADFVTAMMAFFMLLWLISNPDKERLKGLAEYFSPSNPTTLSQSSQSSSSQKGVGNMPGSGGQTRRAEHDAPSPPRGQPTAEAGTAGNARGGTAAIPDASLRVLAQEMRIAVDSLPGDPEGKRAIKVEEDRDGVRISLMDTEKRSMFKQGTAALNAYAVEVLSHVADKLSKSDAQIAIEGHTDGDGAGSNERNWSLSAERAIAARRAMIAAGMPPGRFAEMVAMADTRPVYPDQPDRAENRRITIIAKGSAPSLPRDTSFQF